ncbi:MAG: hypothetical protein ACPKPY_08230 [Nitrososphaeraceae archaeon]
MNNAQNNSQSIIQKDFRIFYSLCVFSAVFTATSGLLHLFMVGPYLKPINFPMELLSYTDTLFIISGILQVLWFIPMIKNWI